MDDDEGPTFLDALSAQEMPKVISVHRAMDRGDYSTNALHIRFDRAITDEVIETIRRILA